MGRMSVDIVFTLAINYANLYAYLKQFPSSVIVSSFKVERGTLCCLTSFYQPLHW